MDWQIINKRAEIIDRIREFFKKENFLEVQTPLLSPALIPESYLEVFETDLIDKTGKTQKAYLTPSPELWHKKLLAAGSGNIFEITKGFRNTDIGGSLHNPEFTILEWYRTGVDYRSTMKDCENLIRFLVSSQKTLSYQNKTISLNQPFERLTVTDAFKKYTHTTPDIDFEVNYVKYVEPNLGQTKPTIIYDFPAEFAPLAKPNADGKTKQRFELYLFGVEIADAYTELTNAVEQRQEFKKEQIARQKLGRTAYPQDENFLKALESGLPDCSGVAMGIDRLIMILTNQKNIQNAMFFPGADIFKNLC
jgi:lysyl-tRNA synthetase class 2